MVMKSITINPSQRNEFFLKTLNFNRHLKTNKWKRARMYGIPGRKSGKQLPANPPTSVSMNTDLILSLLVSRLRDALGNCTQ
jgi:hypothetical protein